VAAGLIAGVLVVPTLPADADPVWSITPTPVTGAAESLNGVACTSPTNCWAVGTASNRVLIELWNGSVWSRVPAPSPTNSSLSAVACPSAQSCFAVGGRNVTGSSPSVLIEHWNGVRWSSMTVPRTGRAVLRGVACPGPRSCYAVGATGLKPLVEHWNGTRWSVMQVPTGGVLSSVACATGRSCIAVGSGPSSSGYWVPFSVRWNGTRWSKTSMGTPRYIAEWLYGVSCPSVRVCIAVGTNKPNPGGVGYDTLGLSALRWNGTRWSRLASPRPLDPGGSGLPGAGGFGAVACTATTSCFGVGSYGPGGLTALRQTLVEHWDGATWSLVDSPSPAGVNQAVLSGVSCPTATSCVAVGSTSSGASLAEVFG
jgi:hypothetical protein